MRIVAFASFLFLTLLPATLSAQELAVKKTADLTPTQSLGRRIFQQRCGVCHTQPTPGAAIYGVALYKDLVDGNEDMIRDYIRNGSKRMPGFKYGLEPSEIDAIVEYLKTVPKPAPRTATPPTGRPENPMD
jgi:mono/diheme cytochrome c family protein